MMGVIEDVANYLEAQSVGTVASSIFLNSLPDVTSTGPILALFEEPGMPPVQRYGSRAPAMIRPRLAVVARSTQGSGTIARPVNARLLAQRAWNALNGVANVRLSTSAGALLYQRIEPEQEPYADGHDDKGRAVFQFTVLVTREGSTAVP